MAANSFYNPISVKFFRRFCFCLFLLLISGLSLAQNKLLFQVMDEKSKQPIQFCYAVVQGKNISSQADANGFIAVKIQSEDTLVIYQLGYYLMKIRASAIAATDYKVFLKSKNITLEEVVVRSSRIDTFQQRTHTVYLDFEFYDEFLLCLVNKGRKYNVLQLLDGNGNVVSELPLTVKAETLLKDCFTNIHVISKDSVYQVYYNYQRLQLLRPYALSKTYALLQACECYHGSKYIFKHKHYQSLKNSYYLYDEKNKNDKQLLVCAADSSAIIGFNQDYDIRYFLAQRRKGYAYQTSVTELNKHLDELRETLVLSPQYANLLRPVESEIKKLDTNFMLFDYTNKKAQLFSLNGQFQSKLALNNFSEVIPKIYIDQDANNYIFAQLSSNGSLTLYRYDKIKNTFTHKFTLKNFYFVDKYKIKENYLYFLDKGVAAESPGAKIIKTNIYWEAL